MTVTPFDRRRQLHRLLGLFPLVNAIGPAMDGAIWLDARAIQAVNALRLHLAASFAPSVLESFEGWTA